MWEDTLLVCRKAFITIGDVIDLTVMHGNYFPRPNTLDQNPANSDHYLLLEVVYSTTSKTSKPLDNEN